jgi:hypothetical protein
MKKQADSCPVDYGQLNQNLVRSYALVIFILLMLIIIFKWLWLVYVLLLDFFLRMTFGIRRGLFCLLLARILSMLDVPEKPVNALPKKFAVKVGFVFSMLTVLLHLANANIAFTVVLVIFAVAVGLEAFFNFCLACKFYKYFLKLPEMSTQEQGIFK